VRAVFAGLVIAGIALLVMAGTRFRADTPATEEMALVMDADLAQAAPAEAAAPAAVAAPDPAPPPEPELRIRVSLARRYLWLVRGTDTLLRAPIAIGMNAGFEYQGRKFHFATPKGTRRVISKQKDPVWTVPEWHYLEKAAQRGHEAVKLEADARIELSDGSFLVVQDNQVGRINHFGNFAAIVPGNEIIFDETIFIPPTNTPQRRVPDALGPYKLDTGDGYLIHGTHVYNEESIGEAVSHGCIRMNNDDLERLYRLVPTGTVVEIY
jgi:lipoprotein-anchoring transpeptidase ErfK/SrfK